MVNGYILSEGWNFLTSCMSHSSKIYEISSQYSLVFKSMASSACMKHVVNIDWERMKWDREGKWWDGNIADWTNHAKSWHTLICYHWPASTQHNLNFNRLNLAVPDLLDDKITLCRSDLIKHYGGHYCWPHHFMLAEWLALSLDLFSLIIHEWDHQDTCCSATTSTFVNCIFWSAK